MIFLSFGWPSALPREPSEGSRKSQPNKSQENYKSKPKPDSCLGGKRLGGCDLGGRWPSSGSLVKDPANNSQITGKSQPKPDSRLGSKRLGGAVIFV